MTFSRLRRVSTKALAMTALIASTASVINIATPQSAHASFVVSNSSCAAETSTSSLNSRDALNLTMAVGDTITITTAITSGSPDIDVKFGINGSFPLLDIMTVGTFTYTVTSANTYSIAQDSEVGVSVTYSCALASTDTAEDVQKDFTDTQVVNQLSSLYNQMSNNARGSLNGGSSNSINGQGFNLSANAINPVGYNQDDGAYSDFNVWASGQYTSFDATSFDGYTTDLVAGIDYKISESMLYGVLVGYGKTDFDTLIGTTTGSLKADALTAGIYAAKRLENGLTFDALIAYTATDYDLVNGTATANFDAKRIGFSAGVYNSYALDNGWIVEPHAKLIIAREKQDAYTDSLANAVAARSITSGRVAAGPRVHFDKDADFSPWASLDIEYDFSNAAATATSVASFDGNLSARPAIGFDYSMDEQTTFHFNANVGGLGSSAYTSFGIRMELNRKF